LGFYSVQKIIPEKAEIILNLQKTIFKTPKIEVKLVGID